MNIKLVFLVIASSAILTACASSSGVQRIGTGTYSLTIQAATASDAKQKAITEASEFCQKQGKTMEAKRMGGSSDVYGWHSYEINFACQ